MAPPTASIWKDGFPFRLTVVDAKGKFMQIHIPTIPKLMFNVYIQDLGMWTGSTKHSYFVKLS